MNRIAYLSPLAALMLGALGAPAPAQSAAPPGLTDIQSVPRMPSMHDNLATLKADCGAPDLVESAMDSCLERARVLEETDPSPEVTSLEAQIEQRANQRFNPNGVDQGAPTHAPRSLAQGQTSAVLPGQARDPDDMPPAQLAEPEGIQPSDPQAMGPPSSDMANDDLPPIQDTDADEDDGAPPNTDTDDPPPPADPPPEDDPPGFSP